MRGFHTGSFDPQTLTVLETAFDEAWLTLKAAGNANANAAAASTQTGGATAAGPGAAAAAAAGAATGGVVVPLDTLVIGNLVKVISWYDNEYGYACRLSDITAFVARHVSGRTSANGSMLKEIVGDPARWGAASGERASATAVR